MALSNSRRYHYILTKTGADDAISSPMVSRVSWPRARRTCRAYSDFSPAGARDDAGRSLHNIARRLDFHLLRVLYRIIGQRLRQLGALAQLRPMRMTFIFVIDADARAFHAAARKAATFATMPYTAKRLLALGDLPFGSTPRTALDASAGRRTTRHDSFCHGRPHYAPGML